MFCKSSPNDEDDQLYTKQFFNTKKLLLLGTGESGKTTIIKQMKILHINGFSERERQDRIPNIKQNIHESIYDILYNMERINPPVEFKTEEAKKAGMYLLALGPKEPEVMTDEYYNNVEIVWADEGVKESFNRSNEYQLIDSAEHFLNRIQAVRQPDYIPDTQDILFCRIKTTSISKIEFEVPVPKRFGGGMAQFWMYDVGGQRGERKKWIQVFDGIEAILFLIAASDFDQTLREDTSKNRLEEAFQLFQDICRSRFVRDAGLIVFLNKQDLLKRKIEAGRTLGPNFEDYADFVPNKKDGDPNNEYDKAKLYMRKKIEDIASQELTVEHIGFVPGKNVTQKLPPRPCFTHFTIATDTKNIKKVFESVQAIILESILGKTFSTF